MQPGNTPVSGLAARERALLVRSALPVGVDHLALDAGGRAGPSGARRLADHVAVVPEPRPARGERPHRRLPGPDGPGLGAGAGLRSSRRAPWPRHPRPALHRPRHPPPQPPARDDPAVIPEALAEAGLPPSLAAA